MRALFEEKLESSTLPELIANTYKHNPYELLSSLRKVLACTLLAYFFYSEDKKSLQEIKNLYFFVLSKAPIAPDRLCGLYKIVIEWFLFQKKTEIPSSFFQGCFFLAEEGRPHPLKNAEASILLALLGFHTKCKESLEKSIQLIQGQKLFLDDKGELFPFFLEKEQEASKDATSYVTSLAFSFLSKLDPSFDAYHPKEKLMLFSKEQLAQIEERSPLFQILFLILEKTAWEPLEVSYEQKLKIDRKDIGLEIYEKEGFRLALSLSGFGSGLGSLKKISIEIVSMGPQIGTLEDLSHFGIYRFPFEKTPCFKELKVQKEIDFFIFDGWTRLKSQKEEEKKGGKTWLHVQAIQEKKALDLQLKVLDCVELPKVFFIFFVKASKLIIDKSFHLQPHTLDRYNGVASSLCFIEGADTLALEPSFSATLHAIPLSGGAHFWGADFLVAFELAPNVLSSFKIF